MVSIGAGNDLSPVQYSVVTWASWRLKSMMTSSNGNIFRVTGHLCGEFTGPVKSPHKGQWRGALIFSLICVWINGWVNNREAGDLRRYRAHYDVVVMRRQIGCLLKGLFGLKTKNHKTPHHWPFDIFDTLTDDSPHKGPIIRKALTYIDITTSNLWLAGPKSRVHDYEADLLSRKI